MTNIEYMKVIYNLNIWKERYNLQEIINIINKLPQDKKHYKKINIYYKMVEKYLGSDGIEIIKDIVNRTDVVCYNEEDQDSCDCFVCGKEIEGNDFIEIIESGEDIRVHPECECDLFCGLCGELIYGVGDTVKSKRFGICHESCYDDPMPSSWF
jgi:hypothetical protein